MSPNLPGDGNDRDNAIILKIIHLRDIEVDICIILVLLMRVDEAIINVQPKYNLSSTLRNWWNTVSVLSFIPSIKLAKFRLLIDRIAIYLKVGLQDLASTFWGVKTWPHRNIGKDRKEGGTVCFHRDTNDLWKTTNILSIRNTNMLMTSFSV
jgi:hypothetical protein